MRKTIIAGNWKMYKTIKEGQDLVNALKREVYELENIDIVICPPYTLLSCLADMLVSSNISLGAQDAYWQDEGAFTGEVSPNMLKDAGCEFVIIGHSERRQYFGETNETVNKKIKAVLRHNLTPIVCCGETLEQREKDKTFEVLTEQINNGLSALSRDDVLKMVIAYEPVWAIGTGKTATAVQAQEAQGFIRDLLARLYNKETADEIRIQYGGSVKPENISELMQQPDIDGALVGGASLSAESFSTIVNAALACKGGIKKAGEVKK